MPTIDIDDGEPTVAQPASGEADLALIVGASVYEPFEHALILARRVGAQSAGYPTHQATFSTGLTS